MNVHYEGMPQQRACIGLLLLLVGMVQAAPDCGGCPPEYRCTFRVLAVGDSLTKGAVPSQQSPHPYSLKMTDVLRNQIGARRTNRAHVQVTTAGLDYMGVFQKARDSSGKDIEMTMVPYVQQQLQQAKQAGSTYQWVVVLAGINDLGNSNKSAAAIMPRLTQIYDTALATGANVIAVQPWPNRFVSQSSDNERQRQLLNKMIADYVSSGTNKQRSPRVYLQQLPADWFDFWSMPADRLAQMQDDKLHLTPAGYDRLGALIGEHIMSRVGSSQCLCPSMCVSGSSNSGRRNNIFALRLPAPFRGSGL